MRYGWARSRSCASTSCVNCSANKWRNSQSAEPPGTITRRTTLDNRIRLSILAEDHAALLKLRNPLIRIAQHFLEHLRAVLAQQRRLDIRQVRIGGELQRKSRNSHFAEDRVGHFAHHVARLEIRMLHRVDDREHRSA